MLTKEQMFKYFCLINDELKILNIKGEILLTGGASMCLVHEARDMTKDIDALYEPKTVINSIIQKISADNNIPNNWLNDGVKGFLGNNVPQENFVSFSNLKVFSITADYLLAMKMLSARYQSEDLADIIFLMNKLNINTKEKAYEILLKYFDETQILPKSMYTIEEALTNIQKQGSMDDNPTSKPTF
jgi:hypothetical protein